jgi:hypothetical protein
MTDERTALEDRLRATYQAVADQTRCSLGDLTRLDAWSRPPRRRHRRGLVVGIAVAAVVLVALAVGAVALLQSGGDTSDRSIVANGGPSGVVTVTTPPPVAVPADWKTVEYHGVQVSLPSSWRVLSAGECPGVTETVLLGAEGKQCPNPPVGRWIWLGPARSVTADERRRCVETTVGAVTGCGLLPANPNPQVQKVLIDGTDAVLVAAFGARSEPVTDSIRLAKPSVTPVTRATPDAAATRFVAVYLRGSCPQVRALADHDYKGECAPAISQTGSQRATPTAAWSADIGMVPGRSTVLVDAHDTHGYLLRLRYQWSTSERQGVWKVVSIRAADPNTPPPGPGTGVPECLPVSDASGKNRGCVHKEVYLADPQTQAAAASRYGGIPVYKNAKSKHIVGVVPLADNNEIGLAFVPNRLIPKIPELKQCANTWLAHAKDATQPPASNECLALLRDYGMQGV